VGQPPRANTRAKRDRAKYTTCYTAAKAGIHSLRHKGVGASAAGMTGNALFLEHPSPRAGLVMAGSLRPVPQERGYGSCPNRLSQELLAGAAVSVGAPLPPAGFFFRQ